MSKTNKNEPFGSSLEVSTVALGGCGQGGSINLYYNIARCCEYYLRKTSIYLNLINGRSPSVAMASPPPFLA